MENSSRSLEEDINLVKTIYEQELEDNQLLEDILEDSSILWMDDLAYVINTITKNLDTIAKKKFVTVPSTFLKEEDRQFALRLLTQSFIKSQEYSQLVYDSVSNWDSDRLVATDIALIVQGITEAVYFETIPLKVTINEYVEISKYYSTPNSKVFVNGLLDKIIGQMNKDGKIVKSGRGLVG
ncbi:MAG: transcription antitermination protein NusB [Bacteroidales bacterium]|nr:transcription antitermination protein NusB [Bacteroidales bacterium]